MEHTHNTGRAYIAELQQQFLGAPGYLSAATAGLPTKLTAQAVRDHVSAWESGKLDPALLSAQFENCRNSFAAIAGVTADRVAIGSQVSQLVSIVAASLPAGSEVLCVRDDFASLAHPFVQREDLTVRFAPLEELAASVRASTQLIAYSLVQSANGKLADHIAIRDAARQVGARTLVDLTQSLGWLNIGAEHFDFTVCHGYKWLCAPRGVAFLTVQAGLDETLTPVAAGWYSAEDVWSSCYADHMPLAENAGRFDLSPVWPAVAGTAAALRFFKDADIEQIQHHDVTLANMAREVLGLDASNSAIVSWADPSGAALKRLNDAGITAAGRAGNARISFHVWNTESDVEMLRAALSSE